MTAQLPRTTDFGVIMYDEKNRVVTRLNGGGKKLIAYIEFSDIQFDFSDIIRSVLNKPISYDKLMDTCWKRILSEIELVKSNPKYAAIFTRIEVGRGLQTMRSRLTQIVQFVYDFWYESHVRYEFERERNEIYHNSNFNRRINRQNYYFGN